MANRITRRWIKPNPHQTRFASKAQSYHTANYFNHEIRETHKSLTLRARRPQTARKKPERRFVIGFFFQVPSDDQSRLQAGAPGECADAAPDKNQLHRKKWRRTATSQTVEQLRTRDRIFSSSRAKLSLVRFTPRCAVFKKRSNRLNRACHWNAPKHHNSSLSATMFVANGCFNESPRSDLPKWWDCIRGQSKKLKRVK